MHLLPFGSLVGWCRSVALYVAGIEKAKINKFILESGRSKSKVSKSIYSLGKLNLLAELAYKILQPPCINT